MAHAHDRLLRVIKQKDGRKDAHREKGTVAQQSDNRSCRCTGLQMRTAWSGLQHLLHPLSTEASESVLSIWTYTMFSNGWQ